MARGIPDPHTPEYITMKLERVRLLKISPSSPFDFDSTFYKPDHFTSGDSYWKPGVRWQTWRWKGKRLGLRFKDKGTRSKPKIEIGVYYTKKLDSNFIESLSKEICYRYNLDLDLRPFYKALGKDRVLGRIIKHWRGMRPGHPSSLYEYLIIGIVLQNATVRRSVQMFQTLLENYGKRLEFGGKKLWCFWEPGGLERVSEQDLRDLKMGYRAKSIKKIDGSFAEGELDELDLRGKSREAQMEKLLSLYGVGPATVWYLLFDVFHHWDFFNHVSPWEQKIYSKLFFNKDPERPVATQKILKYFERYGDYKQLAVHYIWEDLWWQRKNRHVPWLEKQIRL